ncbi:unnamed protein product [Heterobilharzia americana]|nr:unnamed protein product [Heterobilharzia americana]CAH8522292.1 unnamed protein product [Heterobilharzia americana]
MQLQPPAYESLVAVDMTGDEHLDVVVEQGIHPVKRRPFSKSLRNRLNHIVSMYIPGNNTVDNRLDGNDESTDHTGLLSSNEAKLDFNLMKDNELYDIKLIYSSEQIIKSILRNTNLPEKLSMSDPPRIISLAADHNTIYIGFEHLPYIFLISTELTNTTKCERNIFKGYLNLHSPGVGNILPIELCTYSVQPDHTILYIVGIIQQTECVTVKKKWILAKFDSTGQQLARSRVYSYQRYSGLSVDTNDGHLLLACPSISECVTSNNNNSNNNDSPGQICKLTPGFERRIFSITMGKESVFYKPNYVTQETAGHCCWASVERLSSQCKENLENIHQPTRRLLAFPGRQPNSESKQSARDWLHAYSWDFADLKPGRICAYDANRLLVIDSKIGTLSYITWSNDQEKPNLYRITRPSSKPIRLLYSTYNNSPTSSSEIQINVAYFVAGSSIFSFSFRDNTSSSTVTANNMNIDHDNSNNTVNK